MPLVAVVQVIRFLAVVVTVAVDVVRTVVRRRLGWVMVSGVVHAWTGAALVILEMRLAPCVGDVVRMPAERRPVLFVVRLGAEISTARMRARRHGLARAHAVFAFHHAVVAVVSMPFARHFLSPVGFPHRRGNRLVFGMARGSHLTDVLADYGLRSSALERHRTRPFGATHTTK